jgi:transposase
MSRYIEGQDRQQVTLLPECLDDFIAEDNTVRIVDVFINELDLVGLGFEGANPAATGRPSYHPSVLLKLYLYGYLNRIQSSRRLERECQRNVELMWLTGRLAPDFKTIADFRRDNGKGIRNVCRRFVMLCRELKLFTEAVVAIDGSKFKAVNNRERNFTPRLSDASGNWRKAFSATSMHWRRLIGPSLWRCRPRPIASKQRSRRCDSACKACSRSRRNWRLCRIVSSPRRTLMHAP